MKNLYFVVLCCLLGFTTSCSDDDNATALLQIDPSTDLVFEAVGGTRTIEVKTDQATWQVESNQAWCKVAQSDGTHFTVTAEENTASEPKPQAVVTVTAGTAQAVLKVDQKGTETPPVTGTTFKITLGEPTPTGVNMKVVPSDNDAVYYYDVLSKQILDQHHSGDLAVYMKNMMAEAVKNYGSVEEALKKLGSQGESNYAFEGLDPNTDYLAFAAGLDAAGEVNTAIEKTTFKTKELAAGATFKVEFTCYYNGADFTITPSDLEFPYYSAIRPAFRYQGLDDDALLQTIIAEDSFMLDFMAAPGVYEYENEGVYLPDTEYWVLIFGWAAGAPTTSIQKFPFRTSKPNIDPAACQFTVTHSDLTSRGMNISIKPSDDTVPYMFDLISEADYERYKADMKAYVTEYVGQDIDNLDNNRVCGQSGYSYTKVLEPGTKYYVWVASIDEFGKPQAEVYVSDPIETLPKAVSNATVTATIDKYFNGDDLYALDNEKYADCQGQAYVMVTFAAENAKEWYGTMIAEDPNDPTSAIPDDEVIETLLVGGTWCPTGKLYLCKWDTEHTILAVGVAADENPGVLLRQSHTFTKAGASPVSEFVAPESQGVRTGTMRIAPHVASVRNYK